MLGAWFLILFLAMLIPDAVAARADALSRSRTIMTAHWLFAKGDIAGAHQVAFDDREWSKVTLPHSYNAGDGEHGGAYYRGPAWYRRTIHIGETAADRRLFLQFDGAATIADLYVNGRHIGRHEGGHAAFRFDITDAIVKGSNLLAVRVDNSANRTVSPLGGDFTLFGGLYRPVWLIEVDRVHFDLRDHGGPGIYVNTTSVDDAQALLKIRARVANDGPKTRKVSVETRVTDQAGREVARTSSLVSVPARSVREIIQTGSIPRPRLWDGIHDPHLYSLSSRIGEDGDEVTVPLGIRTLDFDPAKGLHLNGKPYPLRGANLMHSARPGRGTAVTDEEIREDFEILRDMGSTGVRLVHFQHPSTAYHQADRLGLAAWTEIGINSEIESTTSFRANAVQQLRELIAQTYNHPSVVMWGIGNEVYSEDPSVAAVLKELHQAARDADPTRPTVYAHCCQADDHPKATVTDLIGFNRYFGWYPDQSGNTIGNWAESFHRAHPDRPFAVSEYGAGASILHQEDPPRQVVPASGWHPEQFQALYHERNWRELADKPYLFATFVWTAFDLASAGRHEGDRPGINDKGLVTYDRNVRKDAFYWYRANWSDRPTLYITSRRFTLRHDPDVEVKAYTSGRAATLLLNGVVVSTQAADDHILRWKVALRRGLNRIEVRDDDNGLIDTVEWRYEEQPQALAIIP